MTVSINSVTIPDPSGENMPDRGNYKYEPPASIGNDGEGMPIRAGYGSATWTMGYMTPLEWAWWADTLLGGDRAKKFTAAVLWDDDAEETTFERIIVHKPEAASYSSGMFQDVAIKFTGMVEA